MPISAGEAIQEAGNANALKAGLTGAAKNAAIGALVGAATGAASAPRWVRSCSRRRKAPWSAPLSAVASERRGRGDGRDAGSGCGSSRCRHSNFRPVPAGSRGSSKLFSQRLCVFPQGRLHLDSNDSSERGDSSDRYAHLVLGRWRDCDRRRQRNSDEHVSYADARASGNRLRAAIPGATPESNRIAKLMGDGAIRQALRPFRQWRSTTLFSSKAQRSRTAQGLQSHRLGNVFVHAGVEASQACALEGVRRHRDYDCMAAVVFAPADFRTGRVSVHLGHPQSSSTTV